MPALMVQGTSSWAGKSLLTTVLCRHLANRGVRVAPFKAQNMSNNARVVKGGEIGVAQYLQARAARADADVRMNPVLIKPEGMTRSQVVLMGRVERSISELPWTERAPHLWPAVLTALRSLLVAYDVVVLEGAGSPAEINLLDSDLANTRAAAAADASVLLVTDIDRGGAFAHLFGTWALLDDDARRRIRGFVLNKFRGDQSLLDPAPSRLTEMTDVPCVGVVPWLEHRLPDEDGAALSSPPPPRAPRVAVVRYPMASNLDEFKALEQVAAIRWARSPADLADADLVILPGSKHVAADLAWLHSAGLAPALAAHADGGGRLLGICGGLQMLGERLDDPHGVDGSARGLGLLPLTTVFRREKLVRDSTLYLPDGIGPPWAELAGMTVPGYEIRHGQTTATGPVRELGEGGMAWISGAILGTTMHGVVDDPTVLRRLFGADATPDLDATIDDLTAEVMAHLDVTLIEGLVGLA